MGLRNAGNYIYVVVSGLVILACVLLVALNWANSTADFSLYGKTFTDNPVNLSLLMLFSAIGGIVLYFLGKLFLKGSFGIMRVRREKKKLTKLVAETRRESEVPVKQADEKIDLQP